MGPLLCTFAERLQEGVGHAPTNNDAVCFVNQVFNQLDPQVLLRDVNIPHSSSCGKLGLWLVIDLGTTNNCN